MDPFGGSFSAVSKLNLVTTRLKALDEIYIFSFAPFQISVIFQGFGTIFAKLDTTFVDFQRRRQIENFRQIFADFFRNFAELH